MSGSRLEASVSSNLPETLACNAPPRLVTANRVVSGQSLCFFFYDLYLSDSLNPPKGRLSPGKPFIELVRRLQSVLTLSLESQCHTRGVAARFCQPSENVSLED